MRGGCVACHGTYGQGGMTFADSSVSADMHNSSLTADNHHNGKNRIRLKRCDNILRKRAITMGRDPDGKTLHWIMPRWKMSEKDLDDIIEYLKSLQ